MGQWIECGAMAGLLLIAAIFLFGPDLSVYAHYGLIALSAVLIVLTTIQYDAIERFFGSKPERPPWEVPRRVDEFDDSNAFSELLDRLLLVKTSSDARTEIYRDPKTGQRWKLIHWDVSSGTKRELFPLSGKEPPGSD